MITTYWSCSSNRDCWAGVSSLGDVGVAILLDILSGKIRNGVYFFLLGGLGSSSCDWDLPLLLWWDVVRSCDKHHLKSLGSSFSCEKGILNLWESSNWLPCFVWFSSGCSGGWCSRGCGWSWCSAFPDLAAYCSHWKLSSSSSESVDSSLFSLNPFGYLIWYCFVQSSIDICGVGPEIGSDPHFGWLFFCKYFGSIEWLIWISWWNRCSRSNFQFLWRSYGGTTGCHPPGRSL